MQSKKILTATSLFCCQKNWPTLLRAIDTFTKTIYRKESFCLELNYLSGENIRLSLLTQENKASVLLKLTDEYFKEVFCKLKSETKKQNGEIFKSLDQNSIYYGLYSPIRLREGEQKNFILQFRLSKMIIAALKDEVNLDNETILTLAYYLFISAIKILKENFPVREGLLTNYFKRRYYQPTALENKLIKDKFKENKSILLEISNSIGTDDAPKWISKWGTFILEFFSKEKDEKFAAKIFFLFEQTEIQLGLSQSMKNILYYFVLRSLPTQSHIFR